MEFAMKYFSYCSAIVALGLSLAFPIQTSYARNAFIRPLNHLHEIASTVPANGDVNPYGVAVVEETKGALTRGNILVSNFNNEANAQGMGTTIVQVTPKGDLGLFATLDASKLPGSCPGGVGLTTALVVLKSGWVVVGSLATEDGMAATAQAGCLIILDSSGTPVETLSGGVINGPWDMTALDLGDFAFLFVTNVLNGTVAASGDTVNEGSIVRIALAIPSQGMPIERGRLVIASGFGEHTDPDALVVGPTGLGLNRDGTLFVADTVANRVAAIPHAVFRFTSAGVGRTVLAGTPLNSPLGLAVTPNDEVLVVNAGDGNLVSMDEDGSGVEVKTISPNGAGALFGLAVKSEPRGVYFVDDGDNTLNLLSR